jgi:hypothetical protein
MYLGALLGLLYQVRLGKRGGMPGLKVFALFTLFLLGFTIDGVNSYLRFFPQTPALYEPQNLLRLITGTGIGLGIAGVLLPTFNQSVWADYIPKPALSSWRQIAELLLLSVVLVLLILSENPLALYPLAILSALTVLLVLTLVYTVVWTMVLKQDNRFRSLREMWPLILAGFTTALLQIGVMDAGRFFLTGTWEGFRALTGFDYWETSNGPVWCFFSLWALSQRWFKCLHPLVKYCFAGKVHQFN